MDKALGRLSEKRTEIRTERTSMRYACTCASELVACVSVRVVLCTHIHALHVYVHACAYKVRY